MDTPGGHPVDSASPIPSMGEAGLQERIEHIKQNMPQMDAGIGADKEAQLKDWLGKVDDLQAAVKYIMSDEYTLKEEQERKVELEAERAAAHTEQQTQADPKVDAYKKKRYTSDYSRFEKPEFTQVKPKKVKKRTRATEETMEQLGPKPERDDTAKLASWLMKKEAILYKERGNECFKKGDMEGAEEAYSAGLTLNPAIFTLYNNRAQTRLKLKKWTGALEDCNEALEMEPLNMKAVKRRAVALQSLRRSDEAIEDIRKAIKYEGATKELRGMLRQAEEELVEENKVRDCAAETLNKVSEYIEKVEAQMKKVRTHGPEPPPAAGTGGAVHKDPMAFLKEMRATFGNIPELKTEAEEEAEAAAAGADDEEIVEVDKDGQATNQPETEVSRMRHLVQLLLELKDAVAESDATRIHFRWTGGIDLLVAFLNDFKRIVKEGGAASDRPEWDVLIIQLFDLLDSAFQVEYNLIHCVRTVPKFCETIIPLLVANSAVGVRLTAMTALKLLVTLSNTEAIRGALLTHMTVDALMSMPHHVKNGDNGSLQLLLQLLDNLLKSETWCDILSDQPLPAYVLPMMHPSRSRGTRDSAAGCVMRLTTDARFRAFLTSTNLNLPTFGGPSSWGSLPQGGDASGDNDPTDLGVRLHQSILHYICTYLTQEAKELKSPFALEAILASLHNCLCDSGNKAIIFAVASQETITACLDLVTDDAAATLCGSIVGAVNVRARALGLIAKCISVPDVHGLLKTNVNIVDLLLSFVDTTLPEEEGSTAKEVLEYASGCEEHAVTILAAMIVKESGDQDGLVDGLAEYIWSTPSCASKLAEQWAEVMPRLVACLQKGDRVAGNAALIFSELSQDDEWVKRFEKRPGGLVVPLLTLIKKKRAEQHDELQHLNVLRRDGLPAPTPSFALNIGAQKNAAICLARLAKDKKNLERLRDAQGFDILSTTLKYVNQGQTPKAQAGPSVPSKTTGTVGQLTLS